MKHRSLRERFTLQLLVVLVMLAVEAGIAVVAVLVVQSRAEAVLSQSLQEIHWGKDLRYDIHAADDDGAWWLLSHTTKDVATNAANYQRDITVVSNTENQIRAASPTLAQQKALSEFDTVWASYQQGNNDAFAQFAHGAQSDAQQSYVGVPFDGMLNAANASFAAVNQNLAAIHDQNTHTTWMIISITLVLCVLTLIFGIGIARSVLAMLIRLVGQLGVVKTTILHSATDTSVGASQAKMASLHVAQAIMQVDLGHLPKHRAWPVSRPTWNLLDKTQTLSTS